MDMTTDITIAVIGLLGAIVGGGLTSVTTWLIARGERTKFGRERLWDLRREAYTKIIASIVPATRIAKHMEEGYEDNPHEYDASDRLKQALEEFVAHFRAAQEAFHIHRLLLSCDFAQAFEGMLMKLDEVSSNQNLLPPEAARLTSQRLHNDCQMLMELARHEIDAGVS
jgi:hypothetical protein